MKNTNNHPNFNRETVEAVDEYGTIRREFHQFISSVKIEKKRPTHLRIPTHYNTDVKFIANMTFYGPRRFSAAGIDASS